MSHTDTSEEIDKDFRFNEDDDEDGKDDEATLDEQERLEDSGDIAAELEALNQVG